MLRSRLERQISRSKLFRSNIDWAVDSYSRLLHAFPRLRMPGRGQIVTVRLSNVSTPIYIRLGTSDHAIVSELFENNEYDWVFDHIQDPVEVVFDLGGNTGLSLRLWYNRFKDLRSVVAVEPDADNMSTLRRQMDAIGARPITIQACVVNHHKPITLVRGHSASAFHMTDSGDGQELVATVTLKELLDRLPSEAEVDFLKCDIEGAERELFKGCRGWIGRVRNMVVETHPPYSNADLIADVTRFATFERVIEPPRRPGLVGFFGRRRSVNEV